MHITAAADRQHTLAVQRPGQVAAVALSAAGAAGHDAGGRNDFRFRLAAAGAGEGLDTGLRLGRRLRHLASVPRMAERVHVSVHVAVAAGASVRRVALFRAGRRCDNILVAVHMRKHRNNLRLGRTAARAGKGLEAGLGFRRLFRHFSVAPCVAECVGISIHIAVTTGAGVGRIALFRAGRRCDNILVAVGMGNIIVMDVGGQKAIIPSRRNRDRFPFRLAPGIVHIGQRCAVTESLTFNARHAAWDRHAGQRCAITESTTANTRHAVRDRHAGQRCATFESITANARHAVRDRHAGQRCAIRESTITNARHAVRNRHAGQRCAMRESSTTNARHAVRDRHAGQR